MAIRTCTRCHIEKPLTDFHIYDGKPLTQCKECLKQKQREYRRRKPESEKKRRKRYIKESLKNGMRYRIGLKYILEMPTETHGKCTKCRQWKTLYHFRKDNSQPTSRPNYYRTICNGCERARYPSAPPRPRKTEEEKRIDGRISAVLAGDGCCLYCWKTDFWKLNNHHPWKQIDPNFTLTLCENHHAFSTRGLLFLLEKWY